MAKIDVSVSVSKEAYELGQGVAGFVGALKVALENGWQTGEDLPAVVTAAISNLVPALEGVSKVGDELKEDKAAFAKALGLSTADIIGKF
jgi:hypothetical protein